MSLPDLACTGLRRRHFLQGSGLSLGAVALASLSARSQTTPVVNTKFVTGVPRAKNIIYLQMLGGPSQLDLFDYKPKLQKLHGSQAPAHLLQEERLAFIRGEKQFLASPYRFERYGQSGAYVCEHLPELARVVDDLTFVRSVQSDQFNHGPAQIFLTTGFAATGRPSMGAWLSYGLGSLNDNLPTFVAMVPGQPISGGKAMWGSGFLPAEFQGTQFRVRGEPVPFVANPPGVDRDTRGRTIAAVNRLNQLHHAAVGDEQITATMAAYELAFQMQSSVPELMAIENEPASIRTLYGLDDQDTPFARSCLLARRLVERGVRFVQICYEGEQGIAIWDSHGDTKRASLEFGLPYLCRQIDRPTAGLIQDLKLRGLLDETLVVWGGEFGRTAMIEDRPNAAEKGYTGRDHWPKASTMWFAGGGVPRGFTLGTTDELGMQVVEDPVHVHDLNATILHLFGVDHAQLTYRFQGRDFRLTDVHGEVVDKLLA